MTMSRNLTKALAATAVLLTAGAAAQPVLADAMMSETAPARVITVAKDKSLSFRLDQPATKIVVAQPDIAEVVATTDRSFYVRGVETGTTNLLVFGPGGRLMEVIDVRVGADAASLQQDLADLLPHERISVQPLGQGVLLTGTVSNPGVALRAKAIAERMSPEGVTNMLKVNGSQVVLEVRILEANRSVVQDMGIGAIVASKYFNYTYGANLPGSGALPGTPNPPLVGLVGNASANGALRFLSKIGGDGLLDGQIAALEEKGVVRTLARPNLVAMSGEKASFLAGGEFPFPVPAGNGNITIEFRPYGVKLNFLPTIQDDGTIRLVVEPEVSALDTSNTIRILGINIPALTVRRTSTTVEMHGGESLAIGGLFQHGYENDVKQLPGLGEIPILSALFRSTRWKRNESELLIVVTPRLVTPQDMHAVKDLPGKEPGLVDLYLMGHTLDRPMAKDLRGPSETIGAPIAAASRPATLATASRPAPVAAVSPPPQPQLRGPIAAKTASIGPVVPKATVAPVEAKPPAGVTMAPKAASVASAVLKPASVAPVDAKATTVAAAAPKAPVVASTVVKAASTAPVAAKAASAVPGDAKVPSVGSVTPKAASTGK
ncbi:MAG: pilus assembly protein N-terminal domain-containing protein [Phenylobacterium sp.]